MAQEILIIAGEASADQHGAHLVAALRERQPDLGFYGVGGRELKAQGMQITVPAETLNVVGVADWFDKVSTVLGGYRRIKEEILRRPPALAVLIDLPDFNLRLSKFLKKHGIPVVYYISPQIWAWRRYRVHTIRKNVDRMLVVFPFEKAFYESKGVSVEFVGHPLLDHVHPRQNYRGDEEVRRAPRIALLPGSRLSELRHHAELVAQVSRDLKQRYPDAELRVPVASTLSAEQVRAAFASAPVEIVEGDSRKVLEWADIALVASGTATLETAMIGTPFSLFYRMSPSTSWVIRHLIRYRGFLGMPNLLHGREVAREFLHADATPEALLQESLRLIEDGAYRKRVTEDLRACRLLLGESGAGSRVADQVVQVLKAAPKRGRVFVPAPA